MVDDHRAADSTLYVLCASAAVYAHANAIPPYPYLWQDGAQHARDAQQKLEALFAGADPPTFVAQYQRPLTCNPSGVVNSALRQRYRQVANVSGAIMWVLRAAHPDASGFGSNVPSRRA